MNKRTNIILIGGLLLLAINLFLYQAFFKSGPGGDAPEQEPHGSLLHTQVAPEGYYVELWKWNWPDSISETTLMVFPEKSPIPARFVLDIDSEKLLHDFFYRDVPYFLNHHVMIIPTKKNDSTRTLNGISMCTGETLWQQDCPLGDEKLGRLMEVSQIARGPDSTATWWTYGPDSKMIFYVADIRSGEILHKKSYPWASEVITFSGPEVTQPGGWIIRRNPLWSDLPLTTMILGADMEILADLRRVGPDNGVAAGNYFYYGSQRKMEVNQMDLRTGEITAQWEVSYPRKPEMLRPDVMGAWDVGKGKLFWLDNYGDDGWIQINDSGKVEVSYFEKNISVELAGVTSSNHHNWTDLESIAPYSGEAPNYVPFYEYVAGEGNRLMFWDTRRLKLYRCDYLQAPYADGFWEFFRMNGDWYAYDKYTNYSLLMKLDKDSPSFSKVVEVGKLGFSTWDWPVPLMAHFRSGEFILGETSLNYAYPWILDANTLELKSPRARDTMFVDVTKEFLQAADLPPADWN